MRVSITILAALLLSCAGSRPPSTVTGAQPARVARPRPARMGTPAGDRWRTAATEHFVLFSNGSDAQMHFGDAHGYFKAAAEQPDATAVAHFLAARTAYTDEDGRFVDPAYVKARVDRALELAPRFPAALGFRAVLLAKKDPKEAARLAERAALLSPAEPAYELRAGRVLARGGQREKGIQRIRSSIRRQLAIRDRTSESSAEMCLEGSLAGFAKEVAPLCDDAIALEPEGRRARLAAAQDVRWLLQNDYYVNRPYEYIWLEALENGAPATYETFRALGDPTWGL